MMNRTNWTDLLYTDAPGRRLLSRPNCRSCSGGISGYFMSLRTSGARASRAWCMKRGPISQCCSAVSTSWLSGPGAGHWMPSFNVVRRCPRCATTAAMIGGSQEAILAASAYSRGAGHHR